jgi:hypothetical protein
MPSFRDRPLPWLFVIATAWLDAIALPIDNESAFSNSLVLGQLCIAGGWVVLGQTHRLVRAATFVAAIGLLSAPDYVLPRLRSRDYVDLVWPHVMAELILLGVAIIVVTFWWLSMARLMSRGLSRFRRADWQFPVAEMFGWTIIVAIASIGMQRADFSLVTGPRDVALAIATATVAGAIMALSLGDHNEGRRVSGTFAALLALGIIMLNVIVLAIALPVDQHIVIAGALAYTACWALVLRLDRRAAPADRPTVT